MKITPEKCRACSAARYVKNDNTATCDGHKNGAVQPSTPTQPKPPKPWKPGDAINPQSVDADSLGDILLVLQNVLDHMKHPRKIALDKEKIERALDDARGLAEDLGKLSGNAADAENYIDENWNESAVDALDTLRDALTDNLPPWVWSEALDAAEKGDTIRVRKVFELS
jgi:hypothetical protein